MIDEIYMKKALDLALLGVGKTKPNPLVGAVLVKNKRIIGEGYHQCYGGDHAEVVAINNAIEDVAEATIYITLEPCSHFGKTPPCVDLLIKSKLARVVIAMLDPNPIVKGNGVKKLRAKGIDVTIGILEDQAKRLNEIYCKYIETSKPFCIMKFAMTLDGKTASYTGDSKWISNSKSRQFVHMMRSRVSGIMVGVDTIIKDNPKLTTRLPDGGIDAIRIIVDTHLRIPLDSHVLKHQSNKTTIIATTELGDTNKFQEIQKFSGVQLAVMPIKSGRVDLPYLINWLGKEGIDSILVEGGATLNFSMLNEGLIDKVVAFIAPKILGGIEAKTPVSGLGFEWIRDAILLKEMRLTNVDEDIMIEAYL